MKKLLGSPVTAVVSIIMLVIGGKEFYDYVLVPHGRRLTGGL